MKKIKKISFVFIIFLSIIIQSNCKNDSNWTEESKREAINQCMAGFKSDSRYKNFVTEKEIYQLCECFYEKMKAKYKTEKDAINSSSYEQRIIVNECLDMLNK